MVNQKLMEGMVGRNLEGGYSNAEGIDIQRETAMDTAGEDGIIVAQHPVASLNYGVHSTTAPNTFDGRPSLISGNNADAGSKGVAQGEPDMLAGEQVPITTDTRSIETTTVTKSGAPKSGLTEQQKNLAMLAGLIFVVIGGYYVVKKYNT